MTGHQQPVMVGGSNGAASTTLLVFGTAVLERPRFRLTAWLLQSSGGGMSVHVDTCVFVCVCVCVCVTVEVCAWECVCMSASMCVCVVVCLSVL
jgi:hypothetical protein